ncbi:hypothetical protein C5S53_15725 [Methanophagales archaeon]|nr:hypothetical protein C5S53_15725 [Methanophagales archaeon]
MVGIVAVAIAMLLVTTSIAPVVAQDVSAVVAGIDNDMAELIDATEIIHMQTDAILGVEGMPDEVKDMVETVHLSSHALAHIGVYMENNIAKLDTYKAEPEKNKAKMLVTVGKIEALRKLHQDTIDASDFVTTMELPVTGKAPHELVHVLVEDPDVKASPEAKSAADAIHDALHAFDDASKAMRLNLEDLEYTLAKPPVIVDISAVVEGIDNDMAELIDATEIIHEKTDAILGVEGIPEEVAAKTETVHLSSHALAHIGVYMENNIAKLDTYEAEPEKNTAKILVTVGKIEALRKLHQDTIDAGDFVTTMELPVTGKAPHELVHVLVEDPDVIAKPEAKSAADAIHDALHAFDDASKAMRLNLEDLEYTMSTAAAAAAPAAAPAAASTPTPTPPGFEAIFAIAGILAVAYLVHRRIR